MLAGVPRLTGVATRSTGIGGTVAIIDGAFSGDFNMAQDFLILGRTVKGILRGLSLPKLFIPKLIHFWKDGQFPFDKLVKFYKLDEVNQAFEDSPSGKVIKPILVMQIKLNHFTMRRKRGLKQNQSSRPL